MANVFEPERVLFPLLTLFKHELMETSPLDPLPQKSPQGKAPMSLSQCKMVHHCHRYTYRLYIYMYMHIYIYVCNVCMYVCMYVCYVM